MGERPYTYSSEDSWWLKDTPARFGGEHERQEGYSHFGID
jgi:hypothetical protein